MSYDIYTGMLKMMSNFDRKITYIPNFTYDHIHPKLSELKDTYNLTQAAGKGGELSQAINLLNWLSGNTFHSGDFDNSIPLNAIDLLNYTFKQPIEKGVNCQALAKILTECCLAIGLKARTIYIMPFNPYEEDNHVVTIVFINDLDKWIMLDPSYNAYMMNQEGKILSPWEARHILSNQGYIKLNEEYNYNGDYTGEKSGETHEYYIEYMAKDLFWFFCYEKSSFGLESDGSAKALSVTPLGYDRKEYFISNIEYRIKNHGESKGLLEWLESAKREESIYISFDDFVKKP